MKSDRLNYTDEFNYSDKAHYLFDYAPSTSQADRLNTPVVAADLFLTGYDR